jgi:hypothetical protein
MFHTLRTPDGVDCSPHFFARACNFECFSRFFRMHWMGVTNLSLRSRRLIQFLGTNELVVVG